MVASCERTAPVREVSDIDVLMLLRVLARRSYVVVPALVLGVLASVGIRATSEPVYDASGTSLLLVPNVAEVDGAAGPGFNPYLDFSGSLVTTAQVVADVVGRGATREVVARRGGGASYEVTVGERIPTLTVSATGPDPVAVVDTIDLVFREVARTLERLQDAVRAPVGQRIAASPLVAPGEPRASRAHVTRAIAVVLVLSVMAAVSLAMLAESLATARERSARRVDEHVPDPDPDPEMDADRAISGESRAMAER